MYTDEDYDRLEEQLKEYLPVDFDDIRTKEQLDVLLDRKGFYQVKKNMPEIYIWQKKKHILDKAWNIIRGNKYTPVTSFYRPPVVKPEDVVKEIVGGTRRPPMVKVVVGKPGRRQYHKVKNRKHRVKRLIVDDKRFNVVVYRPKGFKKSQIRDVKSGKILGWM